MKTQAESWRPEILGAVRAAEAVAEAEGIPTAEAASRLSRMPRSDLAKLARGALDRIGGPTRCVWPGCQVELYLIWISGASWIVERRLHWERGVGEAGEWVLPIHHESF